MRAKVYADWQSSLNQLPEIIRIIGSIKSLLIVTDKQMVKFGYVKKLQEIKAQGRIHLAHSGLKSFCRQHVRAKLKTTDSPT